MSRVQYFDKLQDFFSFGHVKVPSLFFIEVRMLRNHNLVVLIDLRFKKEEQSALAVVWEHVDHQILSQNFFHTILNHLI